MPQRTGNGSEQQIFDFGQIRAQKLEEKRRNNERVFFKHLLSVYSVAGNASMCPIELVDVSEEGCSFQLPYNPENPWPKDADELPIRIYFSQDTYLEIRVRILNSRPSIEANRRYVRYGCAIDRSTQSFAAYQQFVRFLKMYSEHAHKDMGDVSVFYL